jgi:hypothetical protein
MYMMPRFGSHSNVCIHCADIFGITFFILVAMVVSVQFVS